MLGGWMFQVDKGYRMRVRRCGGCHLAKQLHILSVPRNLPKSHHGYRAQGAWAFHRLARERAKQGFGGLKSKNRRNTANEKKREAIKRRH